MPGRLTILLVLTGIFLNSPKSEAQKKSVDQFKDLSLLFYSTLLLQSDNQDSINFWMRAFATKELAHIDSIYEQDTIINPDLNFQLANCRGYYNYILGNYSNLSTPDDIVARCSFLPDAYKTVGTVEFKAYEQTVGNPEKDFVVSYQHHYENYLASLANKDKVVVTNYILDRLVESDQQYDNTLKQVLKQTSVADTVLMFLVRNYARKKMFTELGPYFRTYLNQLVKNEFTFADTLRGMLTPYRNWWNVLRYDITVRPEYTTKTISGKNEIQYRVSDEIHRDTMQIDLQEPLEIDSIFFNRKVKLHFSKTGNAWLVAVPRQKKSENNQLLIYYHGKVHEAVRPPWDGGWIWGKDTLGNPWMSATCEGIGASIWFPCKDHLSDEPDLGASLSMIVPDSLTAVANGRTISKKNNPDGTTTFKWAVINPINNYDIIPYIGKYVHFKENYPGLKGNLDLDFWVMPYHLLKAQKYMPTEVANMLKAFESWYGPYPFYQDGYKLIEGPSLGGMEHQSAVSYGFGSYAHGNPFKYSFSGTPWEEKWDYMIVHESGHEWFGNSITCKDIADMWVQEGFTCFSETLYTDFWFGRAAGNEYNVGLRKDIKNRFPMIGYYGVNDDISIRNGDIYPKGSSMLQTIRHSMSEEKFKYILKELNIRFYHQTVTSKEIENEMSRLAGFDYHSVFTQYLRHTDIPVLEYYFSMNKKTIFFRFANCIAGFNLPLTLKKDPAIIQIFPTTEWQHISVSSDQIGLFDAQSIENWYYLKVKAYPNLPKSR